MDTAKLELALLHRFALQTQYRTALQVAQSNWAIGIADKAEYSEDKLQWEEIEPFIRVLGISSKDLWIANTNPDTFTELQSDIPHIEVQIQQLYTSFQRMLGKNPEQEALRIHSQVTSFQPTLLKIREKHKKCLDAHYNNLDQAAAELQEVYSLITENRKDNIELRELDCKVEIAQKKRELLESTLTRELYNEKTLPALEFIRNQLTLTIEQQTSALQMLSKKVTQYEANPQLTRLVDQYTLLLRAINEKQRDLDNLGQS